MINTGNLRVYSSFPWYITCSIPMSGWRVTCSGWRAMRKKHVINRVKFKQTCREVQVLNAVHFGRTCFAIEAEQMISPFSKLLENGQELEKTINMKKFRIFCSFSTAYYLPQSNEVCRNHNENTFLAIFKIDLNRKELGETIHTKKFHICSSFPTPYHLLHLDLRLKIQLDNTNSVNCIVF